MFILQISEDVLFLLLLLRCQLCCFVVRKIRKVWNYFPSDVSRNRLQDRSDKLRYGFQWVNPDATINVELNLSDSNTAMFLEILYFTWALLLLFPQNTYVSMTNMSRTLHQKTTFRIPVIIYIHCESKKDQRHFSLITLPNVNRFWKFFTTGFSKNLQCHFPTIF